MQVAFFGGYRTHKLGWTKNVCSVSIWIGTPCLLPRVLARRLRQMRMASKVKSGQKEQLKCFSFWHRKIGAISSHHKKWIRNNKKRVNQHILGGSKLILGEMLNNWGWMVTFLGSDNMLGHQTLVDEIWCNPLNRSSNVQPTSKAFCQNWKWTSPIFCEI